MPKTLSDQIRLVPPTAQMTETLAMRNAKEGLQLLMVALALAAAQQQLASAADPAEAEAQTPALSLTAEPDFVTAEPGLAADELVAYYQAPAPFWYFEVESLALKRDVSHDRDFARVLERVWTQVVPDPPDTPYWESSDTVTTVLGTQNLHFDFRAGGRALLGRTLGDWYAVEASYFGLADWNEIGVLRDATECLGLDGAGVPTITYPASLFSPFSDFGDPAIVGLDYNSLATISYSSSLHNIEWNLRRRLPMPPGRLQGSILVGGRYMSIREQFGYFTQFNGADAVPATTNATNSVTTWTGNDMLGVQIGAEFDFQIEPDWWVDCEIKGVIFDNSADQNTTYVNVEDGVQTTYRGSRAENRSTFALDLRLTLTCQINPRLSARVGYQALWIDGLALASENFNSDVDVLTLGPATLASGGKVAYHGPHLGLTWMW